MQIGRRNRSLEAVVAEMDTERRSILWREWLDSFYLAESDSEKEAMLNEEPELFQTPWDAVVAAGTAWLARKSGLPVPSWTKKDGRRAEKPWWCGYKPDSPLARINWLIAPPEFFDRNLFVSPSFMYRARMPAHWISPEPHWMKVLRRKFLV